jgi:hypothetical protein
LIGKGAEATLLHPPNPVAVTVTLPFNTAALLIGVTVIEFVVVVAVEGLHPDGNTQL